MNMKPLSFNRFLPVPATFIVVFCAFILGGCAIRYPQSPNPEDMGTLDREKPGTLLAQPKAPKHPGPPPFQEKLAPLTKEVAHPPVLYSLVFNKAALGDVIRTGGPEAIQRVLTDLAETGDSSP